MTLVVGVDEAGYAPHLGPLVIGLSAWRVAPPKPAAPRPLLELAGGPGDPSPEANCAVAEVPPQVDLAKLSLYRLLRRYVTAVPDGVRLAIADSKVLYSPAIGIGQLELGVLAVDPKVRRHFDEQRTGQVDLDCDDCPASTVGPCRLGQRVKPLPLGARMIYPGEFNRLVSEHGTKGTLLSHATLGLVRRALDDHHATDVRVTCDKHGGRNQYADLVAHFFPEATVETFVESRRMSRYLVTREHEGATQTIDLRFRMRGESQMETALASMTAKYLRELAMQAFNRFWLRHFPDLKPTAGYPTDSRRFWKVIRPACRELGLEEEQVWRGR